MATTGKRAKALSAAKDRRTIEIMQQLWDQLTEEGKDEFVEELDYEVDD